MIKSTFKHYINKLPMKIVAVWLEANMKQLSSVSPNRVSCLEFPN